MTPPVRGGRQGRGSERGSVLLLFPAAVVVLLVLAAIAVDLSMLHAARRELLAVASQAADDGAAMVDRDELHRSGRVVLDPTRAERVVRAAFGVARLPATLVGPPDVVVDGAAGTVTVTAAVRVDRFFGGGVPGAAPDDTVSVTAVGRLVDTR